MQNAMAIDSTSLFRNLSRLEMIVAVVMIGILVALFLSRMQHVEVAAESASLRNQVQDMQSRLMSLRTEQLMGHNPQIPLTLATLAKRIGRGSLLLLEQETELHWDELKPGNWAYLKAEKQFVYRTIAGDALVGARGSPAHIRFEFVPIYAANAENNNPAGRLLGAQIRALE